MPIRLSGINSGLDTDAIVQELVNAYSLKTQKYEKAKTKLEWKQDAWKNLNTKIYGLYTNISNLRYSSAYNMRRTSVSDATKATVTASDTAVTGTQKLNILKNAQAAYITGGKLGDKVTSKTKLSELGFTGETSITISKAAGESKDITVNGDTTVNDFVNSLKEAGMNASFDETNKRLFISAKDSGADNDFELLAGDANGNKVLKALGLDTALTETVNGVTQFTSAAAKYAAAYTYYSTDYDTTYANVDAKVKDYMAKQASLSALKEENEALTEKYEARTAYDAIQKALQEGKYADVTDGEGNVTPGGSVPFTVEDLQFLKREGKLNFAELTSLTGYGLSEDTANAFIALSSQLDTVAAYEAENAPEGGTFDWNALEDAETFKNQLADKTKEVTQATEELNAFDSQIADIAALGTEEEQAAATKALANRAVEAAAILADPASAASGGATKISGSDAQIRLNGVIYNSSSNTFSVNGLTIDALGVTGDGDDNAITITTTVDTQGIYDKIKDFLTEYNSVINEMTKLYNADSASDYEPLTDDEKDAMSDSEIEKWENKIKSALLRRDSSLDSIMSSMINSMSQSITVDGKKLSLSTFGISTLGYLNAAENEQYAYHIDGDEDDANSSGKTDKLMAAIQNDPDQVTNFMKQLATNLYQAIDSKMKSTTMSSAYKVYNDKEMDKQLEEYEDLIEKWEDKIAEKEDYYYNKFSQMEVALSKLQSQTNSLAGMLGTS